jgi:Flp pilus assembly protein CpaB
MQRKRWGLPVALGLITAVLLVAALWPKETPQRTLVVAARDLGAGTTLVAADLTTAQAPADAARAPADAVADPGRFVGQTLAVVRFAGEPVTPRHIGPAVTLAPDERGIAVKVQSDTGLAGLLRPGMKVGLVATLADGDRDIYAKSLLEGLRVVYVSPDFQARPYTPATASATVTKSGGGALGMDSAPATSATGNTGTVREGVLVLAASTQAQPVRYETITDTLKLAAGGVTPALGLAPTPVPETKWSGSAGASVTGTLPLTTTATTAPRPPPVVKPKEPPVRWVIPVELIAALNAAQNSSFTLVLLPEASQFYTTAGLTLADMRNRAASEEPRR